MTTILFGTEDRERAPVDETIVFSSILIEQRLIQSKKKVKKKRTSRPGREATSLPVAMRIF